MRTMIIKHELPPEWIMQGCMSQFRISTNHTVWTYGDTIYNPGGINMPEDLIAHESTHAVQQENYEGGKDAWWKRYLIDADFRAEQEAQAYGVQYASFCSTNKDRNRRALFLNTIAGTLSGPLYQVAMNKAQASKYIKELAEDV